MLQYYIPLITSILNWWGLIRKQYPKLDPKIYPTFYACAFIFDRSHGTPKWLSKVLYTLIRQLALGRSKRVIGSGCWQPKGNLQLVHNYLLISLINAFRYLKNTILKYMCSNVEEVSVNAHRHGSLSIVQFYL